MSCTSSIEEQTKLINKKLNFQRCFYSIIGIGTTSVIIFLTYGQIRNIKQDNHEFAFYILLVIHSIGILISILSTAVFCRITNAVLTTLVIVLLSVYAGVHYYIRFFFNRNYLNEDFQLITIRLGFVLILLILLLPWTNFLVHEYRMNTVIDKEIISPRSTTFSWFLYLDFMLIISLLILKIRSQADFGFHQIILLSIGILLTFLWLYMGILMANNKSDHWIILIIFYMLSLIQIIHLFYIISFSISEYHKLSKINESTLFPLLIIRFICIGTNVLIHLLTIIISFVLINK